MVTTQQSLQSPYKLQRRKIQKLVTKPKSVKRKKDFSFQEHDDILLSLRKNKQKTNSTCTSDEPNGKMMTNSGCPIWKANRAAMENIGKVSRYERNITDITDDINDDSTFGTAVLVFQIFHQ